VSVQVERPEGVERAWWARLPRLLYAPAEVFEELRDESPEAADARQEPLVAVCFLAGIGLFFALFALEQPYDRYRDLSALTMAVQIIFGGALVGISIFWIVGAILYLGTRGLGSLSGYRLARHVAGLASAPLILVLIAIPVRVALYGFDLFRAGGSDTGAGPDVFVALDAFAGVWALALLLIGIRTTQRWSWGRAAAALGVAALFAILVGTLSYALGK
jgi:Yip1 domain